MSSYLPSWSKDLYYSLKRHVVDSCPIMSHFLLFVTSLQQAEFSLSPLSCTADYVLWSIVLTFILLPMIPFYVHHRWILILMRISLLSQISRISIVQELSPSFFHVPEVTLTFSVSPIRSFSDSDILQFVFITFCIFLFRFYSFSTFIWSSISAVVECILSVFICSFLIFRAPIHSNAYFIVISPFCFFPFSSLRGFQRTRVWTSRWFFRTIFHYCCSLTFPFLWKVIFHWIKIIVIAIKHKINPTYA